MLPEAPSATHKARAAAYHKVFGSDAAAAAATTAQTTVHQLMGHGVIIAAGQIAATAEVNTRRESAHIGMTPSLPWS